MQNNNPKRYDQREALQQGTLFPGLDLPFHRELKSRFPAVNSALSELMALDFAIDEMGLYLTTHSDDQEALELYWSYIRLAKEGRKKYEAVYGPLRQTTITEGCSRLSIRLLMRCLEYADKLEHGSSGFCMSVLPSAQQLILYSAICILSLC